MSPSNTTITATFDEAVTGTVLTVAPTAGGTNIAGSVTYEAGTFSATFVPSTPLAYSTSYEIVATGAQDLAGNTMAPASWTFTTEVAPPPPPSIGPGGPIGVITSASNPFSTYFAEILRGEGLNAFATLDVAELSANTLSQFTTVLVGNVGLTAQQVSELTTWVEAGGNLIASRPDTKLAPLLGLTPAGSTLAEGYIKVDATKPAGAGIVTETMQFHGTADRYTLTDANAVATLYSTASSATSNPAVTLRAVGTNGGHAAAFTYDLATIHRLHAPGQPCMGGSRARQCRFRHPLQRPLLRRCSRRLGQPVEGRHPPGGRATAPACQPHPGRQS